MQGIAAWILMCIKVVKTLHQWKENCLRFLLSSWFWQEKFGNCLVWYIWDANITLGTLPLEETFPGVLLALKFRFEKEERFTIAFVSWVWSHFGPITRSIELTGYGTSRFGRGMMMLCFFVSPAVANRPGSYASEGLARCLWKAGWCNWFTLLSSYVQSFVSKFFETVFTQDQPVHERTNQNQGVSYSPQTWELGNGVRMVANLSGITKIPKWVYPGLSNLLLQFIPVTLHMLWKRKHKAECCTCPFLQTCLQATWQTNILRWKPKSSSLPAQGHKCLVKYQEQEGALAYLCTQLSNTLLPCLLLYFSFDHYCLIVNQPWGVHLGKNPNKPSTCCCQSLQKSGNCRFSIREAK